MTNFVHHVVTIQQPTINIIKVGHKVNFRYESLYGSVYAGVGLHTGDIG